MIQECDYLRAIAKPRLRTSTVVDIKTGKASCQSHNILLSMIQSLLVYFFVVYVVLF